MKKITKINPQQFDGLPEAMQGFEPFEILGFRTDPGYGYEHVKMLFIVFSGKYCNGQYGLAIYDTRHKDFIEEPSPLEAYETTVVKVYRKYGFKFPNFENASVLNAALELAKSQPDIRLTDKAGKVLWTGIGNLSGLHGYAYELLKEKFEKSERNLTKKLTKVIASEEQLTVQRFNNITRDRGRWENLRIISAKNF